MHKQHIRKMCKQMRIKMMKIKTIKVFVLILQNKIMNSKPLHLAEGIDGDHWRDINRGED